MNKIKEILKKGWEYIYHTKMGKLIASLLLAVGSFGMANIWDFMFYVGLVFLIYPIGLFLVMMAYAWVINPIRDWKESQKAKSKAKSVIPQMPDSAIVTQKIIEIKNNLQSNEIDSAPIENKTKQKKTVSKTKNTTEKKKKNNKK